MIESNMPIYAPWIIPSLLAIELKMYRELPIAIKSNQVCKQVKSRKRSSFTCVIVLGGFGWLYGESLMLPTP
jgi:hypothetical protein